MTALVTGTISLDKSGELFLRVLSLGRVDLAIAAASIFKLQFSYNPQGTYGLGIITRPSGDVASTLNFGGDVSIAGQAGSATINLTNDETGDTFNGLVSYIPGLGSYNTTNGYVTLPDGTIRQAAVVSVFPAANSELGTRSAIKSGRLLPSPLTGPVASTVKQIVDLNVLIISRKPQSSLASYQKVLLYDGAIGYLDSNNVLTHLQISQPDGTNCIGVSDYPDGVVGFSIDPQKTMVSGYSFRFDTGLSAVVTDGAGNVVQTLQAAVSTSSSYTYVPVQPNNPDGPLSGIVVTPVSDPNSPYQSFLQFNFGDTYQGAAGHLAGVDGLVNNDATSFLSTDPVQTIVNGLKDLKIVVVFTAAVSAFTNIVGVFTNSS